MQRSSVLIPLAVAAVVGATAGSSAASAGRDSDRFEFAGVEKIVVDNRQGHVDVTAGGSGAVEVERTTTSFFTKVTQTAYVRNRVLHLTTDCDHVLCLVDFRIAGPKGVDVQVRNRYADVTVTGSPGDVKVVTTREGDITLDLAPGARRVSASTHDGDVTINGRVQRRS
jgi:hypothetical protein